MPPRSYLATDTYRQMKQTSFNARAERDLFQQAFDLNAEADISNLSSLLDPPTPTAPASTQNLEPAPLPIVVSPRPGEQQQDDPLGPEFANWRREAQPQQATTSVQGAAGYTDDGSQPSGGGATGSGAAMPEASTPTPATTVPAPVSAGASTPPGDGSWGDKAYAAAVKAGHPNPREFVEQMRWESGNFAPDVISGQRNSSAGAQGIAQIMPQTAQGWGVNPLDPDAALDAAARAMTGYYAKYGDSERALAAYNMGEGNLQKYGPRGLAETNKYIDIINERTGRSAPNAGAPPSAPAASLPTPAGSADSRPAAPAGAPGSLTVRHKGTGMVSQVSPDDWPYMPNRDQFEIVEGAPQAQASPLDAARASTGGGETMAKVTDGDEPNPPPGAMFPRYYPPAVPQPNAEGVDDQGRGRFAPGPPGPVEPWEWYDRDRTGEMMRQSLGQPADTPLDDGSTPPPAPYNRNIVQLGPDGQPMSDDLLNGTNGPFVREPRRNEVPYADPDNTRNAPVRGRVVQWQGEPNAIPPIDADDPEYVGARQYRQPLAQMPEFAGEAPYDPFAADSGAHESGYTVPSAGQESQVEGSSPSPGMGRSSAAEQGRPAPSPDIPGPDLGPGGFPILDQPATYGPYTSETSDPAPPSQVSRYVPSYAPQAAQTTAAQAPTSDWAGAGRAAVEAGQAGVSAAAEELTGTGAAIAGARPPQTADEIIWSAMPAPARAVKIVSDTASAFGDAAARKVAEALGYTDEPTLGAGPVRFSPQDVAGGIGAVAADPTNWVVPGSAADIAADAAVRGLVGAPLRAAGRGVRAGAEGIGRGARALAEEGARQLMDATPSPSMIERGAGGAWDDISRNLDSDAQRAAREAASQPRPRPSNEQLIREEFGRPWEEVPADPATAAIREESGSIARPRNQVSPEDAANLTRPVEQFPNMEGRMNATPGISPGLGSGVLDQISRDVGSSLGSSTFGAAAGAAMPAETDEKRRQNALTGAGIGLVGGPLARRVMQGRGALATPGMSPAGGPRKFANPADALQAAQAAMGRPNPQGPTAGLSRMEALRRWVVRYGTDNKVDLAEFQREAQRLLGRPLEADEMVLELARANPSGAAKVTIDDVIRPAVQQAGDQRENLSTLMRLMNNGDVAVATGNPDRLFSGGLTGADSQAAAAHLWSTLTPEQQKAIDQSSDALYRMVDHYRNEMVRAGVWTPQLAADLAQKYPHWVPTKILDYMSDPATVTTGTRSISLRDRGLRTYTAEGTAKAAEDPIASLVRYVQDSEAIIQKNETFNAFANLRDRVPGWDALIREVPNGFTPQRANGEKAVTGFVNGERKTFVVPAPMAAAIQMEQGQQVPVLRELTQLFKEFITRTPMFVAGQIPLDAFGYTVRESAREGGPLAMPRVVAELGKGYAEAFRGLLDGSFKGDAARYLKEGGGMAGFYERSADAASKTLDDLTRRNMFEVRNATDAKKLAGWLLGGGWVQAAGSRVEMAPRIASFRLGEQRALKAGASPEKAALEGMIGGRDVTLDFQRGGVASKIANQIIPFFNVGVQSATTLPRMIRENPTGAVTTMLSLVAAPTVAAEAWNRMDEQRSKDYDDVPDYVKDRGIVIMLPGVAGRDERGETRPNYALIPMRELAPVAILSRELMQRAMGSSQRSPVETAQAILGAASPVQASGAADLFSSTLPPVASTGLQLAADSDFFRGGPIATTRRDDQASSLAHGIANVTGYRASQVDFGIRDTFGGAGAMVSAASDLATGKTKDEQRIQNTPIVGGMLSRFVGDAVGGNLTRAQDAMRTPEITRVLRDAGLRDDQLAPLDMKGPNDFPFTRREQAQAQRLMNQYLAEPNGLARLPAAIPNWSSLSQQARQNAVRDAAAAAKRRAEGEVLSGIPEADRQRRFEAAARKKAG